MAPHLLENTRNRLGNGRPRAAATLLKSLDLRAAAMWRSSPLADEASAVVPAPVATWASHGSGGKRGDLQSRQWL